MIKNIVLLLRPHQWLKNTFILLPLFFSGNLLNVDAWIASLFAVLAFCFASSSIYCFNDIWDVNSDKLHPQKCLRPIASGVIPILFGYIIMGVMLVLSVCVCLVGFEGKSLSKVLGIIIFYYIMNIAYCTYLKQQALIDVFIISIGFVLRVVVGGFATCIMLSHWIILMTFLLALFLALAKRRDDVILYAEKGVLMRRNVNRYNVSFLNQAITIVASVTLVAYIMYTVSEEVINRFHNHYIYITSIWVLLGILRYLQLTVVDVKSGSPTKVLLKDHFTQLSILGWVVTFVFIIYF